MAKPQNNQFLVKHTYTKFQTDTSIISFFKWRFVIYPGLQQFTLNPGMGVSPIFYIFYHKDRER